MPDVEVLLLELCVLSCGLDVVWLGIKELSQESRPR